MGLLQFANLGLSTPFDRAQRSVYNGLGDPLRYLWMVKKHLERDEAVRQIEWRPARPPPWAVEEEPDKDPGTWVALVDPERGSAQEIEELRAAFLDERTQDVYEPSPPQRPADERGWFRWVREHQIRILDHDPGAGLLRLARLPTMDGERAVIALRPPTYTIEKQIQAIQRLQDAPTTDHRPLIDLLLPDEHVTWPAVVPVEDVPWRVLTDETRAGTAEQRAFVRRALGTPDFMLLEGPPGSGKTTAICELVLQMIDAGKRVLLVGSTHVAVDNVLERILHHEHAGALVAVRIGDEGNVSDAARPYCFHRRVRTEQQALLRFLEGQRPGSAAQQLLRERLRRGTTAVERMVLDSANLVCGTTIGILQYPDIKTRTGDRFDMMILDEASKTTFQEFLVPAVLARRWIIVGDPKQLSPYVEEEELEVGLEAALDDPRKRDACADVFGALRGVSTLVVTDDVTTIDIYRQQAGARDVLAVDAAEPMSELERADVVLASPAQLPAVLDRLPLDLRVIRGDEDAAWRARRRIGDDPQPLVWAAEVAWRLVRTYEQRFGGSERTLYKLGRALTELTPVLGGAERDRYEAGIAAVRRIALPSVLELLRFGFEGGDRHRATALNRGFLPAVLADRRVLLEYQHRMHPDIARLPREVVYDGEALRDAPDLERARPWSYRGPRAMWVHVNGEMAGNVNVAEVNAVMSELEGFVQWAVANGPRPDGRRWEVAVLSFYRAQERELRSRLRNVTGQRDQYRTFHWRGVDIALCTVDRFQGHEADLVLLTFANPYPSNFLESQNRLNVALTRARFGLRIFGSRTGLQRTGAPLLAALQELPKEMHWQGGAS